MITPVRLTSAPLNFVVHAFTFYWNNRRALLERFATSVDDPLQVPVTTKPAGTTAGTVRPTWRVRLPGICVVCGEAVDSGDLQESYEINDLTQPLWIGLSGLILAIPFAWFVSAWSPPLIISGAILLGYANRGQANVQLMFRRCKDHEDRHDLPFPRLEGDVLKVRVGNPRLRKFFDDAPYVTASKVEHE